jgi:hypothetical protein
LSKQVVIMEDGPMPETAHAIRELVAAAEDAGTPRAHATTPASAAAIRTWAEALYGIADRFDTGRQSWRAQERTLGLIATATTQELQRDTLEELIWSVADDMQMCPPHDWDCPIVSKVDPERVTWTCRNCGAIAAGSSGHLPAASR